ncbi:MAG: Stk1 family PASTA domain-containing Ser/Thr kinase [Actinomycetaceae bacterium]|nr:Stk1 family PASTA domain-containing Ser/Thr kinase [Arcanobacterium sp.]MDD7504696.1 Stk1 family PASTA domain-containing Ser/Thr kinase [Actinomycetaceae bacterium]MDY6142966.1 Stk1 family PASTA domain-containing Ser/Thr kinase [Arcanobacterium sp.]
MNHSGSLVGILIDERYRVDALIARGGMASVYQAHDVRLERDVAVKLIHPHLAEQDDFARRFIREARAAAALSSPYIVNVHDQGLAHTPEGELPYLVMELVRGPNLRRELSRLGSLPLGFALELIRQVLLALKDAHNAGIAHRDVKPENILLDRPLDTSHALRHPHVHLKVADFGLARAIEEQSGARTSMMLGTVAYAAPEMLSAGTSGIAGDVYSTGIMLYELIAGELPFHADTPLGIAFEHVNKPVPRLSDTAEWIPVALDSLIASFTERDPSKRTANGSAALQMVDDVVRSIPQELMLRRVPVFPQAAAPVQTAVFSTKSQLTNSAPSEREDTAAHTSRIDQPVTIAPAPVQETAVIGAAHGTSAAGDPGDAQQSRNAPGTSRRRKTKHADAVASKADKRTQADSQGNRSRRLPKSVKFLIAVSIILAALITAGAVYWAKFAPIVPTLSGLSQEQAEAHLTELGLDYAVNTEYSDTVEENFVISSDPPADTKVLPWHTVHLLISDGIEMWTVPSITGLSADEAQQALADIGFTYSSSEEYSEDVAEGVVISQNPQADSQAPHDSEVTFVISKGREPISVPDVVSLSASEAQQMIEDAGLSYSSTQEFSDDVPEGSVISQDIAAGETLYRGDGVSVVVSKGPELIEVPNVFGKQRQDAIDTLEGAGFSVKVDEVLGGIFGTVRTQDPSGGTRVPRGTTVTITVV